MYPFVADKALLCHIALCYNRFQLQCGAVITQFSLKSSQKTSHSSPVRARYGVSDVILIFDSLSATAIAVSCVISWQIRPPYNGTWLYMLALYLNMPSL